MTRIEQALARLERAVARLEAAPAPAGDARAGQRRQEVAADIAARLDAALARISRALGEGA